MSKATLRARVSKQLAKLARLAPDLGTKVNPRLASWPGWIDSLVDDLVLLRVHDPLEALRGLRALDDRITMLELRHEDAEEAIAPILDRKERARGLRPDFHLALAQTDRGSLVERVFVLLTEPGLLDQDDSFPQPLLDALDRGEREGVVRRLIEAGDPAAREVRQQDQGSSWHWSVTELLLADPDVDHALGEIDRLGLGDQLCPVTVVRFLLRHKALGGDFMAWMRRAIGTVRVVRQGEEEDDSWRPDREGIALCESEGLADLAQEIRYASFEILLDVAQLHDWLERLPAERRAPGKTCAVQHVLAYPDRFRALLVLLEWQDVDAAVQLVMEHHDEMHGPSCMVLNKIARRLEAMAPRAAMLLYRRGASCQFDDPSAWIEERPSLAKCATLWARYPSGPYESHAKFMDRLEREKQELRSSWF